jgi:hypothetical protein
LEYEDGAITLQQIWVKKNYMNTYIVGAFEWFNKRKQITNV